MSACCAGAVAPHSRGLAGQLDDERHLDDLVVEARPGMRAIAVSEALAMIRRDDYGGVGPQDLEGPFQERSHVGVGIGHRLIVPGLRERVDLSLR